MKYTKKITSDKGLGGKKVLHMYGCIMQVEVKEK